jgi:hypothetical protein
MGLALLLKTSGSQMVGSPPVCAWAGGMPESAAIPKRTAIAINLAQMKELW